MKPSRRWLWLAGFFLVTGCSRLDSILYDPPQTPASWLQVQPYITIKLGPATVFLVQPSSTFFVYLLGLVAIGAGLYYLRTREAHQSRLWWGAALLLWGLGALCAGTSYEAFSYAIKCAGRPLCSWTSWWEIIYLLLSAASVEAMVAAVAYSSSSGKARTGLLIYAITSFVLYSLAVLIGAFALIPFLISFELLLAVAAPSILLLFGLNLWRYLKLRDRLDLALVIAWLWLGVVIAAYFIALQAGLGRSLWARGVWFTENDILHLGLISWILYLAAYVSRYVIDAAVSDSEPSQA